MALRDALRYYTLDSAMAIKLESVIGSIKVNKYADFVVLSADVLKRIGSGQHPISMKAMPKPTGDWLKSPWWVGKSSMSAKVGMCRSEPQPAASRCCQGMPRYSDIKEGDGSDSA